MWAITVLFTAFAGAAVAYLFQTRNWLFQHKKRIRDEQVAALAKTAERLSSTIFKRITITETLLAALATKKASRIADASKTYHEYLNIFGTEYREAFPILVRENDTGFSKMREFESEIISPLVDVGSRLDEIVIKGIDLGEEERKIFSDKLRWISFRTFQLARDIYKDMQTQRDALIEIDLSTVERHALSNLSNWNLFKLLFIRPNSS